jgi:hypothetical protein
MSEANEAKLAFTGHVEKVVLSGFKQNSGELSRYQRRRYASRGHRSDNARERGA